MSEQAILYEQVDSIAKIWMNRPNQGNRISRKLFLELDSAMTKAIADPSVRVIIISAKGENFCCGFDVGDPDASLNNNDACDVTWEYRRDNTQEEIDLWMKLYTSNKPVIGAIKGRVLGGGYFMAMMFDCIVAADNTVMDNGEFALGMSYTDYVPFDLWKIPMNIAKEKLLTGYPITAKEGFRLGLFNRVVSVDQLDETAMTLARRMLRLSPYTLNIHKELCNMAYDLQGIRNIVPYAKETFNIGMELPGTKENQEMWDYARSNPPGALVDLFEEKLAALRKEEIQELPHLDDLH